MGLPGDDNGRRDRPAGEADHHAGELREGGAGRVDVRLGQFDGVRDLGGTLAKRVGNPGRRGGKVELNRL